MMSPSVIVDPAGAVTVLGTGGANRIRTALTQVIVNLIDHGMDPEQAVCARRCHLEEGVLNAEVFGLDDGASTLARLGPREVIPFPEPNLFFGGVHLVRRLTDGALEGAGDPRRGGACRVL
jgi:gamma-glutamyltranspeptidase/glutathione hydrolase